MHLVHCICTTSTKAKIFNAATGYRYLHTLYQQVLLVPYLHNQ